MHFCHEELFLITSAAAFAKPAYSYLKGKSYLVGLSLLALVNLGCPRSGGMDVRTDTDAGMPVPADAAMGTTDAYGADTQVTQEDADAFVGTDVAFTRCPELPTAARFLFSSTNCRAPVTAITALTVTGRTELVDGMCYADIWVQSDICGGSYALPWSLGVDSFMLRCGSELTQCRIRTTEETLTMTCIQNAVQCTMFFNHS